MRNGKLDKIKEWIKTNRLYLIQAGCVIAIAVIVAAIMIPDIGVTKGHLEATVDRFDLGISHIGAELADLSTVVQSIDNDLVAAEDKVATLEDTVSGYDGAIAAATARADAVGAALDDAVEDLQDQIAASNTSVLEAWLTGSYPDFTVHAMSGRAGNFTAIVHLCYEEPIPFDDFFGSMDWGHDDLQSYVPALSIDPSVSGNSTPMVVTAVSFSIGVFELEAVTEGTIDVVAGGIHEDFAPDWAYVEIWPVWRESL